MGISVILLAYKEENKEKSGSPGLRKMCSMASNVFCNSVYSVCYCFIRKVSWKEDTFYNER